jgi:hypothetical protein
MSFIQRELDRIGAALGDKSNGENYERLYAAQQALAWALEPTGFRSPYNAIKGIPEAQEDYRAEPHQIPFSDIRAPAPS